MLLKVILNDQLHFLPASNVSNHYRHRSTWKLHKKDLRNNAKNLFMHDSHSAYSNDSYHVSNVALEVKVKVRAY